MHVPPVHVPCCLQVAAELRAKVTAATGLTCSVGIGPNTMLAKIASDRHKPNGQFVIESTREAVLDFLRDLPIRKASSAIPLWQSAACLERPPPPPQPSA